MVPASDPWIPALANIASAVEVSSKDTPNCLATVPVACIPWATPVISAEEALAAPARTSATFAASAADKPNAWIACDWMVAASAAPICAAAASCSVPFAASMDCCTVNPPLASSVIAPAASDAEVAVNSASVPRARAFAPTASSCSPVAPDTAARVFICDWNSIPTERVFDRSCPAPATPATAPASFAAAPIAPPKRPSNRDVASAAESISDLAFLNPAESRGRDTLRPSRALAAASTCLKASSARLACSNPSGVGSLIFFEASLSAASSTSDSAFFAFPTSPVSTVGLIFFLPVDSTVLSKSRTFRPASDNPRSRSLVSTLILNPSSPRSIAICGVP